MFSGDASEIYLDLTITREELTFDERSDLIKAHYEIGLWEIGEKNLEYP